MKITRIQNLIPLNKLSLLLLGIAATLQLVIITYNHFTGFYDLTGPGDFFIRFFWGTFLSLIGAFLLALPDLVIIRYLNSRFPWSKRIAARIALQLLLTALLAVIVSTAITLLSHFINTYRENLWDVLVTNTLIVSVLNVLMMIILEAWIFFNEGAASRKQMENLEKELSQIRFEVLKNQINPHFMFNSLNVLSGLIDKDTEKAQLFIEEFSHIYRYVLETIEKPVATVEDELGFARSYMFLQQIRYGKHLKFEVEIPSRYLKMFLPPLSLQVVLENAIKHNLVSSSQPLIIRIAAGDNRLLVANNLQTRISATATTGLGQQNLRKRYALIGKEEPKFTVGAENYQVILPLISE